MRPRQLTLTGFIGIRDGLGRDQFSLDLEKLAGDAPLVALVGQNGSGKSTLLDNLTPYLVMPSRAGADGLGAFSYYDEVFLPESTKDLVWTMGGQRYRSQVAIRTGSRRRSEAYLHVGTPQGWQPVRLPDGTVADGRTESYTRCVEAIAGPASAFFSTAFAAQQRRHLCAYRHAEIKTLLADLLGLQRVAALGERTHALLRLLRTGLAGLRQQHAALAQQSAQWANGMVPAATLTRQADLARQERNMAQARLDQARAALATHQAQREVAAAHARQREQLMAERASAAAHGTAQLAALARQRQAEQQRLALLDEECARIIGARETQRASLRAQQSQLQQLLADAGRVRRAARRLPLLQTIAERRMEIAREGQRQLARFSAMQTLLAQRQAQLAELERMAGQAVLTETGLRQRLRLTLEVPCCGTDLQPRCKLLADACAAQRQLPDVAAEIARLAVARQDLLRAMQPVQDELAMTARVPELSALGETLAQRSHARWQAKAQLAMRAPDCARAESLLIEVNSRFAALEADAQRQAHADDATHAAILDRLAELDEAQRTEQARQAATLQRLDAMLAALPADADPSHGVEAQRRCDAALRAGHLQRATFFHLLKHIEHQRCVDLANGSCADQRKHVRL